MTFCLGSSQIKSVYLGSLEVSSVYEGECEVYSKEPFKYILYLKENGILIDSSEVTSKSTFYYNSNGFACVSITFDPEKRAVYWQGLTGGGKSTARAGTLSEEGTAKFYTQGTMHLLSMEGNEVTLNVDSINVPKEITWEFQLKSEGELVETNTMTVGISDGDQVYSYMRNGEVLADVTVNGMDIYTVYENYYVSGEAFPGNLQPGWTQRVSLGSENLKFIMMYESMDSDNYVGVFSLNFVQSFD